MGEELQPPIDIDLIGELLFEIQWEYTSISGVSVATLAALFPEERLVQLNESFADRFEAVPGLDRFTKAHEIGHWLLHVKRADLNAPKLEADQNGSRLFCRSTMNESSDEENWIERQADWFAAALLMPRFLLLARVRGMQEITWHDVRRLAKKFNVSKQAMQIRLSHLNLIYVKDGVLYRSRDQANGQLGFF